MTRRPPTVGASPRGTLTTELLWYARLRWIAAIGILVVGLLSLRGLTLWPDGWNVFLVLAGVVLAYNLGLWVVVRALARRTDRERFIAPVAATGMLLDLAGLTCLTVTTGGLASPVITLFVIHMVFVSLLMPLGTSYVAAAIAAVMVAIGLYASDQWPATHAAQLFGAGWVACLLLVAYMTDHIARALRVQERQLRHERNQLRELNERLRHQQNAMIQHEKMTALGLMTAGVVHEIANPLSNMDSVLQLAKRRPETLAGEGAESLRVQVERISNILRQMTSFAHPNQTGAEPQPIDPVVEAAIAFMRFDKRLKRIELAGELGCPGVRALLNANAFQQVVVNLITNALDALEGVSRPRVVVRTLTHDGRCLVQVQDNGSGIAPETVARVFDPFFTTKPIGRGTGLGLSISYRLVEQMGGEIRVESHPGEGATFTIDLPVADAPSGEATSSIRDLPRSAALDRGRSVE